MKSSIFKYQRFDLNPVYYTMFFVAIKFCLTLAFKIILYV